MASEKRVCTVYGHEIWNMEAGTLIFLYVPMTLEKASVLEKRLTNQSHLFFSNVIYFLCWLNGGGNVLSVFRFLLKLCQAFC